MCALVTADELLRMPDHKRYELIEGKLVKWGPEGLLHGRTSMRTLGILYGHVYENDLGVLLGAGCGFFLQHDPDTVRAVDGAFIAKGRIPSNADPYGLSKRLPTSSLRSSATMTWQNSYMQRLNSGSSTA